MGNIWVTTGGAREYYLGHGGLPRLLVVFVFVYICTHELTFVLAEPPLVSGPADALVPSLPLVCRRALTLLACVTTESIVN